MTSSHRVRFARLPLTALICLSCCGCAIPIHTATKTRVPSGLETKSTVDPSFIRVGQTSRAEVLEKLGWTDTRVKDDRFFIGRWSESTWGVLWGGVVPYGAAGDWTRKWNAHNLLIEFDEKGVVQQTTYFSDKDILTTLSSLVAKYPTHTLDLSAPIEVPATHLRYSHDRYVGRLFLGARSVAFVEDPNYGANGKHDFQTTPENLRDVVIKAWAAVYKKRPQQLIEIIHFKHHTKVGDQMTIETDLPATMILLKYIAQIGAPSS